jgi:regulator of sigma E protease
VDVTQFLPQFGNVAFTVVAFIVALSVIVAIHEYGHYIIGRATGIKAEVFSLGFGPVLFSRKDRHGTRWQVAALPLGGYVKFQGDANAASVGNVAVPTSDRRHTMLGRPPLGARSHRGGWPDRQLPPAILLFAALVLTQGRPTDPITVATLTPLPPSFDQGLQEGDEILAIAGTSVTVETMAGALADLEPAPAVDYAIRRDGEELSVPGPYPFPPLAGSVSPDSAAWEAGIRPGDVILSVDGTPVYRVRRGSPVGRRLRRASLRFEIWRSGETLEITMIPAAPTSRSPEGGFETRLARRRHGGSVLRGRDGDAGVFEALGPALQQLWFVSARRCRGSAIS